MGAIDIDALSREELEELQTKIDVALAALERRRRLDALADLAKRARELGYTLGEVTGVSKTQPRANRYANPANPDEFWCGRGRKPRWFEQAMAAGWAPEELLI
ncbi:MULTISPECIES: H-NS family nucleoid-associated regulatory protein [Cereibacter]|uniref:DNA-binding protein H-NS n=1 Tax=Cereibacter azotoformans TaxID=43057 RepID=A0A2T5JT99_9RHOB|nr:MULTISPECIES: H-NS histone family protein [Cereibacter]PTR13389.1 DNA-binding protein H-NS [Cereibacter azotoformans]